MNISEDQYTENWNKAFGDSCDLPKTSCPNCAAVNRCHATAIIPIGYEVECDQCGHNFIIETHEKAH